MQYISIYISILPPLLFSLAVFRLLISFGVLWSPSTELKWFCSCAINICHQNSYKSKKPDKIKSPRLKAAAAPEKIISVSLCMAYYSVILLTGTTASAPCISVRIQKVNPMSELQKVIHYQLPCEYSNIIKQYEKLRFINWTFTCIFIRRYPAPGLTTIL